MTRLLGVLLAVFWLFASSQAMAEPPSRMYEPEPVDSTAADVSAVSGSIALLAGSPFFIQASDPGLSVDESLNSYGVGMLGVTVAGGGATLAAGGVASVGVGIYQLVRGKAYGTTFLGAGAAAMGLGAAMLVFAPSVYEDVGTSAADRAIGRDWGKIAVIGIAPMVLSAGFAAFSSWLSRDWTMTPWVRATWITSASIAVASLAQATLRLAVQGRTRQGRDSSNETPLTISLMSLTW